MERSEQIGELIAALAKAQNEFTAALKESNNPYYSSKYADLSAVIGAVRPALNKHGIAIIQVSESDLERQTASVATSIHFGEQWLSSKAEAPAVGKAKDGKDRFDIQTIGAAWTYLRRYTLQALVAVPSEDDDGNAIMREDSRSVPTRQLAQKAVEASPAVTPEMQREYKLWADTFADCQTVEEFNANILPLMKERGNDFVKAAAQVAKERGYKPNRTTGLYEVHNA